MAKKKQYQLTEGYNLSTEIFVHSKETSSYKMSYADCFKTAIRLAKKDKRLLFVVVFNEETQIILKRRHLLPNEKKKPG